VVVSDRRGIAGRAAVQSLGMKNVRYGHFWVGAYKLAAKHRWIGIVAGLGLVGLFIPILVVAGGYNGFLGPSIPLFFLVPILLASTLGGVAVGAIVSVAAVTAWDWFFIPPIHMLTIYYPRDLLALIVFIIVALLTGQLATVARRHAEDAIQRARTTEALYDLSLALIGSHDLPTVLPVLTQRLRDTFDLRGCAILLYDSDGAFWHSAAAAGTIPDDLNIARSRNIVGVLSWIAETGQMCKLNEAQFWPLQVDQRLVGVLELIYSSGAGLDPQRDRLLATLVNGTAVALEQERLFREQQEAILARERDRLKSALLSSISHDLRTPLAGIKAAASSLLQEDVQWSGEDQRTFIADIDAEADRLIRLVSNLLDLSRIEAGALQPNKEWEDVGELIDHVVQRLQHRFCTHPITTVIAPDLPLARFDAVHIEQVLTNLIENAIKYSPDGSAVTVAARAIVSHAGNPELHLSVTDQGIGISAPEKAKIFDKFYRVAGTGHRVGGMGMGLAIAKGLVEANGGYIMVDSEVGQGSTFTVVLPLDEEYDAGAKSPARIRSSVGLLL
jgi:two-component system sensor histidine kinase KdpD